MIQHMKNTVTLPVDDLDLSEAGNIEVCFKQDSTQVEFLVAGEGVVVGEDNSVSFTVPKSVCDKLDNGYARAQIMCTVGGAPAAGKIYKIAVLELLKTGGYDPGGSET